MSNDVPRDPVEAGAEAGVNTAAIEMAAVEATVIETDVRQTIGEEMSAAACSADRAALSPDAALTQLSDKIQALQRDLVLQLAQDVTRLQMEKRQLRSELEQLRQEHLLITTQPQNVSRLLESDRQVWIAQLAQFLAAHLEEKLAERFLRTGQDGDGRSRGGVGSGEALRSAAWQEEQPEQPDSLPSLEQREPPNQLGQAVSVTLHTHWAASYRGIAQDLQDQQSALAQQLQQIEGLQQQGETVLDALVNRMSASLRAEMRELQTYVPQRVPLGLQTATLQPIGAAGQSQDFSSSIADRPPFSPEFLTDADDSAEFADQRHLSTALPPALHTIQRTLKTTLTTALNTTSQTITQTLIPVLQTGFKAGLRYRPQLSPLQRGLGLAALYTTVLAVFHMSVNVIFTEQTLRLGAGLPIGGWLLPGVGNAVFVLLLRMMVVMLLLPGLAGWLFPHWQTELAQVYRSPDRQLHQLIFGGGIGMFLSQWLLYLALGELPTAVAITLFFSFPIATILGAWLLFGRKATPPHLRLGILLVIVSGLALTYRTSILLGEAEKIGSACAIGAGITFSVYVLFTQLCGARLHPVTFSIANFSVVFLLSFLSCCILWIGGTNLPETWMIQLPIEPLSHWVSMAFVLGGLTLSSYILNSWALRDAGALFASMVGATGPIVTGVLASLCLGEVLLPAQAWGMLIVSIGVVSLSLERLWLMRRHPPV